MVKRNDIVAVCETHTIRYVHSKSERREVWRLAKCISASRDGKTATKISYRSSGCVQAVDRLLNGLVRHIEGDNQAKAQRLWNAIDETAEWSSADELRAAILGA